MLAWNKYYAYKLNNTEVDKKISKNFRWKYLLQTRQRHLVFPLNSFQSTYWKQLFSVAVSYPSHHITSFCLTLISFSIFFSLASYLLRHWYKLMKLSSSNFIPLSWDSSSLLRTSLNFLNSSLYLKSKSAIPFQSSSIMIPKRLCQPLQYV